MDRSDAVAVLRALVDGSGHPEAREALPVLLSELDAARAEAAVLRGVGGPVPRALTEAEMTRAYDLCAQVCAAESATVAGGPLGELRDLLAPTVGLGRAAES